MKHLEAFIFLACFMFTVIFTNVSGSISQFGVLDTTVMLLAKSFVAVYFPVWVLRWLISKVWRKSHV